MRLLKSVIFFLTATLPLSQCVAIQERSAIVDALVQNIETAATCSACESVLKLLKEVAAFGNTAFVDIFTELCILTKSEDDDVCQGAVADEGPIIAQALRTMTIPSQTSKLFCITFLGLCSYPPVTPHTIQFPSPKPSKSRPSPSGQPPLKIVHFSDIHVDPFYETGANFNCTKPICCRSYTPSDAPGNTTTPAGPFGNTNCDAPVSLEQSMFAAIQSIVPDASLTLFTGDIVDHAVWLATQSQNLQDINNAYSRMLGLAQVYGTVGNHEGAPVNSFPPNAITTSSNTAQWVYNALAAGWTAWIGSIGAQQTNNFGAYSTKFAGGNLRVISLNTNFYYKQNYWLYQKTMATDPSGQLAWLVNELQAAENAGERVYIIGHMSMGVDDAFHDASNYFDQIVNRYSATIAALFFGHTHLDHFEIAYSDYTAQTYQNAREVSYICPAMTPSSGSPAFRVYTVDPITFGVLDTTTYIANISSQDYETAGPVWEKYYSAKETYGALLNPPVTDPTSELTPAFWHNVTTLFQKNDSAFQEYIARKSRGFDIQNCTGSCKTNEICSLRAAQAQYNCDVLEPGIHFDKRDDGIHERSLGHIESDVCEGSLVRPILAKIIAKHGLLEEGYEKAQLKYRR